MDEEEFDALMNWRPFGTGDAMRLFAQARADTGLVMALGSALWGTTSEYLQRQLLAPHPEIPSGFELADFRKLLQFTARLNAALMALQRARGLHPAVIPNPVVLVGTRSFTFWEARHEIVLRAIDYLEDR